MKSAVDIEILEEKGEVTRWLTPALQSEAAFEQTQHLINSRHTYLRQLRQDMRREERYSAEFVMAVDFSEIFNYLYPYQQPDGQLNETRYDAVLTEALFEKAEARVTLPPAALVELVNHLHQMSRRVSNTGAAAAEGVARFQRSHLAEEARRALAVVEREPAALRRLTREISSQWPALFDLRVVGPNPTMEFALDRLHRLQTSILVPLTEVMDPEDMDIDHAAYGVAYEHLKHRRALKGSQNHHDAVNFAFVAHVNQLACSPRWRSRAKRPYMVLWTRGTVQELNDYDPIREPGNIDRAGLVRDVRYVGARTALEALYPDAQVRADEVQKAIEDLELQLRILYRAERMSTHGDAWHPTDAEAVLRGFSASLVERRYTLDRGDRALLDRLQAFFMDDEPDLLAQGANTEFDALRQLLETPAKQVIEQTSRWRDALDKARDLIDQQLDHLSHIRGLRHTARVRETFESFSIERDAKNPNHYMVTTVPAGNTLARIERKPHAFAVFCNCRSGQLRWFCNLAKHLIVKAGDLQKELPLRQVPKLFEGIDIISQDFRHWNISPLPEDLSILDDADHLFQEATKAIGTYPRYIRINTPVMDLCYDYLSGGSGTASIISHLGMANLVAYFISQCSDMLIIPEKLQKELRGFLEPLYPLFETTE